MTWFRRRQRVTLGQFRYQTGFLLCYDDKASARDDFQALCAWTEKQTDSESREVDLAIVRLNATMPWTVLVLSRRGEEAPIRAQVFRHLGGSMNPSDIESMYPRKLSVLLTTQNARIVEHRYCGSRDQKKPDTVVVNGEWTEEIWRLGPITVPATVDVTSFLAQRPIPSILPDDKEFNEENAGDNESMRTYWLLALLHHPDRTVVAQCLRSGQLGWVHAEDVAYYLADPALADAATEAAWSLNDVGVRVLVNVVLSRGMTPSGFPQRQASEVIERLRSTCPPQRTEFFEAELAGR